MKPHKFDGVKRIDLSIPLIQKWICSVCGLVVVTNGGHMPIPDLDEMDCDVVIIRKILNS